MTGWARQDQAQAEEGRSTSPAPVSLVDLGIGLAEWTVQTGIGLGRRAMQTTTYAVRPLAQAPGIATPHRWLVQLADRGHRGRAAARDRLLDVLDDVLDVAVPFLAGRILDRLDVTAVVRQRVDLDAVVSDVDLDRAAERLDLDGLAARLDIAAVVESLDLDAIAGKLDINEIAARLDLDALLDRFDLNRIVRERIEINEIAGLVDIDAVIARIDLVGLTRAIIEEIDLPEIIRESTGSVASETVHGIRMRSVAGDEIVGKAVDRLLLRKAGRAAIAAAGDEDPERQDDEADREQQPPRKKPPLRSSTNASPP